jgi:soluble lytic murein transglycosylase-like protein
VQLPSPPTAFLPDPTRPVPTTAGPLAGELENTTRALREAVDRWIAGGDTDQWPPPQDVELLSLYQERIYRTLGKNAKLATATVRRLPSSLQPGARANSDAASQLLSLTRPISKPTTFRTRDPKPAALLLGYFKEAQRKFGVAWQVLAAVMSVESRFGRVISDSYAGARGPMQFIPSTWSAYGMGGDVHDPHDAIMGAANYLRASGAPGDYRRALYAYNPAQQYVDAVMDYANQMIDDRRDYYAYYSWQVFVLTTSGDRRLTGPGL